MALSLGLMAKSAGSFIVRNWLPIAIAIVVFAFWWNWRGLKSDIEDLNRTNAALVQEISEVRADRDQLADLTNTTREALEAIGEVNSRLDSNFADLGQRIADGRRQTSREIDRLRGEQAPRDDKESVDYLIRGAGQLRNTP